MPKRSRRSSKWSDVIEIERDGELNPEVFCRYCNERWISRSLQRLDEHKARCVKLPNELWGRYGRGACAPKRQLTQSTLSTESHCIPATEQRELDQLLAEAIYSTGTPFSFVSIVCGLLIAYVANCPQRSKILPSYAFSSVCGHRILPQVATSSQTLSSMRRTPIQSPRWIVSLWRTAVASRWRQTAGRTSAASRWSTTSPRRANTLYFSRQRLPERATQR